MARTRGKQDWEAAKLVPVEFEGAVQDSREGETHRWAGAQHTVSVSRSAYNPLCVSGSMQGERERPEGREP
jgi:hypothetical protein